MKEKTITEEINEWITDLGYWEQYLATRILNGQRIKPGDIKDAYEYFLEDNGLAKKKPDRPTIKTSTAVVGDASDFCIKEIKNIEGVNALKENQTIPISKNLTVVYGDNGVGKSGYIRLFNKAFVSRGDKNIEPNIYSDEEPKEISCSFIFNKGGADYELKYPEQEENYEFGCYAVFDTRSISAHLNDEDEIQFLPNGFEFFDIFSKAVGDVKDLFSVDIERHTPENSFLVYFEEKETSIKKMIEGLNGRSDMKVIREKAVITEEEAKSLDALEKKLLELQKTNVGKKVKSLEGIKLLLAKLKVQIEAINNYFSDEMFVKYKGLLAKYNTSKELSTKEGLAQFKTDLINETGSKEWKGLIVAAKEFASVQYDDEDAYPEKNDVCILCRQPLSKEAQTLLEAYWKYLSSSAEKDLKDCSTLITNTEKHLTEMDLKILDKESVLYAWLKENSDAQLTTWIAQISSVEALRKQILAALKIKKWNSESKAAQISIKPIATIEKNITEKIADLNEVEINKKIKKLVEQIDEFKDRKKLTPLLEKIGLYINKHAWAEKAHLKVLSTRKITEKQKELYSIFVTEEYITLFNNECEKLDANFGIEISQRSKKGATLRNLVLKGRQPSAILSEGEQRAISIADFMTEIQIGTKNRGIIFDDPVNSLDHKRRQIIAERLIDEAKIRQVIIFTHDITFLLALQALAEERKTDKLITTIRKIGNTPGEIRNDIPWVASNVKQKIGKLTDMLVTLKKIEKNDEEEYGREAKSWSGLLREAWERSVEQFLFNDAIQRFSPAIQTQRLKQAKYTPELFAEVEKGMTECSKWVHDQARALNAPPPNTAKLEQYLNEFKTFAEKFK